MRFVTALYLLCTAWMLTGTPSQAVAEDDEPFNAVHHVADGYYLDFLPFAKVELPRLFIVRSEQEGLQVRFFMSTASAIRSGLMYLEEKSESAEDYAQEDASPASVEESIDSGKHLDAKLVPVGGSVVVDLSVTRHLVFALLASGLLLWLFIGLANRYKAGVGRVEAPRGIVQNSFETLIIFVRDEIAIPNLGKERYKQFLPYLLTAFFFILTCNFLGLIPYGSTATSNINVTAVLALFTFVVTQVNGSRDHWLHVFWPPGMPIFVKPLLIPTEILGLFTKPIALAIRLFANLTAGHLVILSLLGIIFTFSSMFGPIAGYGVAPVSVGFTLFVYCLEVLIAFIQAYIFSILSALFIGMAIAEHSHGEAH